MDTIGPEPVVGESGDTAGGDTAGAPAHVRAESTTVTPGAPLPDVLNGSSASVRRDASLAAGVAFAYLLFWQIVQRIPSGHVLVVLSTTLAAMGLTLLFTVSAARALRTPKALGVCMAASAALILPSIAIPLLHRVFPFWSIWGPLATPFRTYRQALHIISGLDGLLLILLAVCVGVLVSRMVREFKILLPMAVALALVDLYVVFGGGLVTQAQSGKAPVAQAAMQALTVQLPTVQPKGGAAPLPLAVGFADFLFIALFFACFARFGIPSRATFIALCALLMAYMLTVFLTNMALPALVPIAVVVIGMNLRRFRYERSEAFALLYAGLIIGVVGLVFYVLHTVRK